MKSIYLRVLANMSNMSKKGSKRTKALQRHPTIDEDSQFDHNNSLHRMRDMVYELNGSELLQLRDMLQERLAKESEQHGLMHEDGSLEGARTPHRTPAPWANMDALCGNPYLV